MSAWADLRALPTMKLRLDGEFVKGEQEVTALWLADLWAALPRAEGADTLLATCTDGYAAVYREAFIAAYRPIVVLEINGQGPEKWPPPGLKFNPGPYVITVAKEIVPGVATLLDAGHKKPCGHRGDRGRELWRPVTAMPTRASGPRSCRGPRLGARFGSTRARVATMDRVQRSVAPSPNRPFEVLAAHAGYNAACFKKYVRAPKTAMPRCDDGSLFPLHGRAAG